MNRIKTLQKWINDSKKIVFFSGAGVSTLSGIKDFRSKDGLYNIKYKYDPEEILSHHFFMTKTSEFYKFYIDKMNCLGKEPNIIHKYLYKLEKENKLLGIVTQNIDNLHTLSGCSNVFELHGNVMRNYCTECNKFYDGDYIFNYNGIPKCECGGIIKPDVILYEEMLDMDIIDGAIKIIKECDMLIVAGTSLKVYPASSFIRYYQGNKLVIINRDKTDYDNYANLVINDELENVFSNLKIGEEK